MPDTATPRGGDPAAALAALLRAQAEPGQPQASFEAFERVCTTLWPSKLLTLLAWRPASDDVQRVYSNRPDAYPVGRRKPMGPTAWGDIVLKNGGSWIGRSAEDMRWAFPDHALIASLGLESCLTTAIRWNGRVLGALSFVAPGNDVYSQRDLETLEPLANALAAPFLELEANPIAELVS